MKCDVCGNKVSEGVSICPVCGNDLVAKPLAEQKKNSRFLTQSNSVLGLGIIALFILFIIGILRIVDYSNYIGWGEKAESFGIVGIIFGIFTILANLGLITLSIINLFRNNLKIDQKLYKKLLILGLSLVIVIAVLVFVMALYGAILMGNVSWFFELFFVNYGFLAIFVFSFLIIERGNIHKDKKTEDKIENEAK